MTGFERLDTPRRLRDMTDVPDGTLIGRAHLPQSRDPAGVGGPTPVLVDRDVVRDLSPLGPTVAAIIARPDLLARLADEAFPVVALTHEAIAESHHSLRREGHVHLLAPLDLQVIKASGVTFVRSLLERMIEAETSGDPRHAGDVRRRLGHLIGTIGPSIRAGTPEALALLARLREHGAPSTYLEVGLGTHAEIFTKAPVLSSVGTGELVGVRADSQWSNPEPEVVLVIDGSGSVRGATLGNDVNLRDLEGRSPLLLGVAKDNNASCAIGPWIRLFDDGFTMAALMATDVTLQIWGRDGFAFRGTDPLAEMSREPQALVDQASGANHRYPDGFALFLGTMSIPTGTRRSTDEGFTHAVADEVRVSNPLLGSLTNWVETCDRTPAWQLGIGALMANLARRGLLGRE